MARSVEIAKAFITLESNTKGLEQGLTSAEKSLGRTASFVLAHPVAALGALGTAAIAVGAKATQMAASFEKSMAEVGTLVDTTSVDMKKLADGVLELFKSLPIASIDDLTKGLYNVISAGVPAAEAIDFLRIAAEASVGGVTDVNTAVDGLTTATNAFASQGLTAKDAADSFFTAVRLGKTTFAEISGSIGTTAGLANTLGISLDDLLANMTALTLGGLDTSKAFTAIRAVLSNVLKPTSELKNEFPALAKQFDVAALKSKGLTGFLVDLAKEVGGNTKAATAMFGSIEGLNGVLSLTSDGGAKLSGIMEEMKNKTGASDEAFRKMSNTAVNMNQILKNQVSVALIDLGNKILPLVNLGLQAMLGFLATLDGSLSRIKTDTARASIDSLTGSVGKLQDQAKRTEAVDLLLESLRKLTLGANAFTASFADQVKSMPLEDLQRLRDGYEAAAASGTLSAQESREVARALDLVKTAIGKLPEKPVVAPVPKATTDSIVKTGVALAATGEEADKAGKKAAAAAEKHAAAIERIRETLIASTTTLIDDTELAIEKLSEELTKAGVAAEDVARGLRPLNDQLRLIKVNEQFKLPDILAKTAKAITSIDVATLTNARAELQALVATTVEGTKEHLSAQERLDQVSAKLVEHYRKLPQPIRDTEKAIKDAVSEAGKFNREIPKAGPVIKSTTDRVTDLGREIAVVARGAIGIAQGFGLVNSEAAAVLQNVITIGENLGKALGGDPSALIGVIGGLTGVIGTLFGESAESKAHKQLISENNQRLRELKGALGDVLRLNTPGAQLASVEGALGKFLGQTDKTKIANLFGQVNAFELGKILAQSGLDRATLAKVAEDLGIEITNKETGKLDLEGLKQLFEALQTLDTTFGESFAERVERIRDLIAAGILDPAEEFAATLDALKQKGAKAPALTAALEGIDVTSAAGRAQGITALQELLKRFDKERGEGGFDLEDFGDLTASQFKDAILTLIKFLADGEIKVKPADTPTTKPEQPPISAATTPSGAVPVEPVADPTFPPAIEADNWDLLLGLEGRQADALDAILAGLSSFQPVAPPSLPPGILTGTSSGNGVVVQFTGPLVETLSVQLAAGQDPQAAGEQFADGLTRAFIEKVAIGLRNLGIDQRSLNGDASR